MMTSQHAKALAFLALTLTGSKGVADQQFFSATLDPTTLQFEQRITSFSRSDTDEFTTSFALPRFDGSLDELNFIAIGYATEENPFFAAEMFAPPSIAAGVNANIDVTYEITAPGTGDINGSLFFNASRTINTPNTATSIVYPTQEFDSGFTVVPDAAHASYVGTGNLSLPYRITYEQEATISNTGMTFAFGTVTEATVLIVYDFTPTVPVPGDYDGNGVVDLADYSRWEEAYGSTTALDADGSGDGTIDAADYTIWRDSFDGNAARADAAPEPCAATLLTLMIAAVSMCSRTSTSDRQR